MWNANLHVVGDYGDTALKLPDENFMHCHRNPQTGSEEIVASDGGSVALL